MTVEEFFGTLQESITAAWRKHLQSDKNSEHEILNTFYEEMPDLVDALIEAYQADHYVLKDYSNLLSEDMTPVKYLTELKRITLEGRELMDSPELESLCDDILTQIDSTLYKLKHLVRESCMSLSRFLTSCLD